MRGLYRGDESNIPATSAQKRSGCVRIMRASLRIRRRLETVSPLARMSIQCRL